MEGGLECVDIYKYITKHYLFDRKIILLHAGKDGDDYYEKLLSTSQSSVYLLARVHMQTL